MKRKCIQISSFLVPQGQHREIVPDHPRELRGNLGEQLVGRELRHKGFGDLEERTQTVALSYQILFGEERLHCNGELAGDSLEEREFLVAGRKHRETAEAK